MTEVKAAGRAVGLEPVHETPSPITGATGNQEFLYFERGDLRPNMKRDPVTWRPPMRTRRVELAF